MATIKIISGDPTSPKKELLMTDGGHTWEYKGRRIKWEIRNPKKSNVDSIEIKVKSGALIFSELPNPKEEGKWEAEIDKNADDNIECKYSIFWKAKNDTNIYEYDPKISVKSSPNNFTTLLIGIIAVFTGILTLSLFFKKIKR